MCVLRKGSFAACVILNDVNVSNCLSDQLYQMVNKRKNTYAAGWFGSSGSEPAGGLVWRTAQTDC